MDAEQVAEQIAVIRRRFSKKLSHKLREIDAKKDRERIHRAVDRIVRRVKALPVLDDRTDDEILGYNKDGLFD